jgi:glycosyltransferase involved in cell wall biosynthesis
VVRISVIVPVRDDPRVDDLLASLALQAAAPDFEVLVAMDGSRREPRVPPGLPARLLRLPPRGPYPARNAAVAEAGGDVLLFTDSDCLCPPDWISVAGRLFESEAVAALQGASRASDDSRLSRFVQREYESYVASHAALGYRRFCNTRNFAIRTAVAREIRLPETLPRGGDGVYGRLLEERGVPIRYEAGWWIAHRHPASRLEEGRRAFSQGDDGARWARVAGLDLFSGEGPTVSPIRGPGAFLLRHLPRKRPLRRVVSVSLLPVAATLAAASGILPERPAGRCFSLFRRACHLSGRLWGESREQA